MRIALSKGLRRAIVSELRFKNCLLSCRVKVYYEPDFALIVITSATRVKLLPFCSVNISAYFTCKQVVGEIKVFVSAIWININVIITKR